MTKRMSNNYPQPGGLFDKVVARLLALIIIYLVTIAGLYIAAHFGNTDAQLWLDILTAPFRYLIYGG